MHTRPEYHGSSIVNLMSSISSSLDLQNPYAPLENESVLHLDDAENIVLMIIDGLGFNYLKNFKMDTLLKQSLKSSMSTVFLPSTGSAISSFFTGLAPQQHAITGWYVYLQEYGLVSRFLPFTTAIDWNVLGVDISESVGAIPILTKMQRDHYVILGNEITQSVYSRYMSGNAERLGYSNLSEFFSQIRVAVKSSDASYIHAYWPQLDAIAHMLGIQSPEAKDHLYTFDKALRIFQEELEGTNTRLIVTSDHGFSDVNAENSIFTRDHPRLNETLRLPLCGDTRTVFCYVKPNKVRDFERYISDTFEDTCEMHQSQLLIDDEWFGLFNPSPKLYERVGDYTLIFKEGHAMLNCFPGMEPPMMIGHHGGISQDELQVPLIVIDC